MSDIPYHKAVQAWIDGCLESEKFFLDHQIPMLKNLINKDIFDEHAVDEILNETLLLISKRKESYNDLRDFNHFMNSIRITANFAKRNWYRVTKKIHKFINNIEDKDLEYLASRLSFGQIFQHEDLEKLKKEIARLPDHYAQSLGLRELAKMTWEEIGDALFDGKGVGRDTARHYYHQARRILKNRLGKKWED